MSPDMLHMSLVQVSLAAQSVALAQVSLAAQSHRNHLQSHRSFCTYQLLHPHNFGGDQRRHSTRLIATVRMSYN